MSATTLTSIALHASGTAVFGYALYHDLFLVHIPPELEASGKFKSFTAFPGRWKYLTIWNLVLQLVYHSFSLINDFVGTNELNKKRQSVLQNLRDVLFASWAFPTGIFVSLTFWILFAIDRALVFPVEMDSFFPLWLNHAVHTGPIVYLTADSYFVPKAYPSKALGLFTNLLFSSTYSSWLVWVKFYSDVWAYPVLDVLDSTQRIFFIGGSALLIFAFYFLGEGLTQWRWAGKGESKAKGKAAGKGKRKTK